MRDKPEETPLFSLGNQELVNSNFDPARLTQARLWRALTKKDLASRINVSAAAVGQYEMGVSSPRPDVIKRLSKELEVSPEFFIFRQPRASVNDGNSYFRSLRSTRVMDKAQASTTAELLAELTLAIERFVRLPEPRLPDLSADASPAEAAAHLRSFWNIPRGPVKHLVATAEANGIVVGVRPLAEVSNVDAFSTVLNDRPYIMTTPRRTENVFRHRFSIAHELGHLVLHEDPECTGDYALREKEADTFAAAFLTPRLLIEPELPQRLNVKNLIRLSDKWGVSPQSLVMRMAEIKESSRASQQRAFKQLQSQYNADSKPAKNYPGEMPSLLKKAVDLASTAGVTVGTLSDLVKIPPQEIRDLIGDTDTRPVLRLVKEPSDSWSALRVSDRFA